MSSAKSMKDMIGVILFIGTILSTLLVAIGGSAYLFKFGHEPMPFDLLRVEAQPINLHQLWTTVFSFSSLGLIQLGLITLVVTQILRVMLVTGFFILIKDTTFTLISLFICVVLLYSFIWRQ